MTDQIQGAGQEPPSPPQQVRGITERDFAFWHQHPVTKVYLQYLIDRQNEFIQVATDRWLAGAINLSDEHEMRGFAKCLDEAARTSFIHMAAFYQQTDEFAANQAGEGNDDDAAEDSQ